MTIENIPVTFHEGFVPIGIGKIVDGELIITIKVERLINEISQLITVDRIRSLSLGVTYRIPEKETE